MLSSKWIQKFVGYAKQSVTDVFKTTLKRSIQKAAEATFDLTGNELTVKIIKISKTSAKNNSETITNKEEIIRETYKFRKKRQQIINDLRLI